MTKRKSIIAGVAAGFVSLLLTGCHKVVVLQPMGKVAADEKHLLILAVLLMLIVVVPVIVLTLVIARKFRASNTKAKYTPDWSHSVKLEFIWWVIPIVIIAILATVTWVTTHKLDPYRQLNVGGKPMTIQAVALRWKWLFIYPKQGIATINYVKFPVNRQVQFQITSDAPMNAFQIQQLAGQIYAMNGMQTRLHMIADHVGQFRGRSVSYSGNGFAGMRFPAFAVTKAQFGDWVDSVRGSSKTLNWSVYQQLVKPSENNKAEFFRLGDGTLYHQIIQSFLRPGLRNASAHVAPIAL